MDTEQELGSDYKVFSKKTITVTLIVILILFVIGTVWDQPLSQLVGNQNEWWAAIIQDMGAFPNVVLCFLGAEVIFQKGTRLQNRLLKYMTLLFSFMFGLTKTWDFFIEARSQMGQAFANAAKNLPVGAGNDYSFIVTNKELYFVVLYIIAFYLIHKTVQLAWLQKVNDRDLARLVIVGLAGIVIDTATGEILNQIKNIVSRPRPFMNLTKNEPFKSWFMVNGMLGSDDFASFPSGHTRCFSMALYFSLFVNTNNAKWKKIWKYIGFTYLIIGGFSRMVMEKHYLSDVAMAAFIGFLGITVLVKLLHLEENKFDF